MKSSMTKETSADVLHVSNSCWPVRANVAPFIIRSPSSLIRQTASRASSDVIGSACNTWRCIVSANHAHTRSAAGTAGSLSLWRKFAVVVVVIVVGLMVVSWRAVFSLCARCPSNAVRVHVMPPRYFQNVPLWCKYRLLCAKPFLRSPPECVFELSPWKLPALMSQESEWVTDLFAHRDNE